jgi:hypothetical protein
MNVYKHTQVGTFLIISYSVVILSLGILFIVTGFNPIALVGLAIMLVVLGLFVTLTVQIDGQKIRMHFGLGLVRKDFLIKDIVGYRVVENPWTYGWGIRFTPSGWLYSVSGLSAIELQMKSGKKYRIGTDDPDGFAKALDNALNAL